MSNIVCDVLHSTLCLLSQESFESIAEDTTPKRYCQKLAKSLNTEYENPNAGNNLGVAFTFLRTAVAELEICYENLEKVENPGTTSDQNPAGDQHLIFYTADGSKLERELREIKSKAKEKFDLAKVNLRKCKVECTNICEDESATLPEKITATKVRVITEILGNLEDLSVASKSCRKIILDLHELQEIRSHFRAVQPVNTTWSKFKMFRTKSVQTTEEAIISVVNISKVVFNFTNKFLRTPVAIFDWPVIKEGENPRTFHPIIGRQPIDTAMIRMPDTSTCVETNGSVINARISAINCKREVFTVEKRRGKWSSIERIADGVVFPFWCPKESSQSDDASELDESENIDIISICADCNGCTVTNKSGESHADCKNLIYVLAILPSEGESVFALLVIDVRGKLLHKAKLTCLPRQNKSVRIRGKIVCTENKIVVFDINRSQVYLCNKKGDLEKPLNMTERNLDMFLSTATITDENEIIVLKKPNKIHFYSINDESFLDEQGFEVSNYEVNATVAFNHLTNEVILLCKDRQRSRECLHLLRCAKTGELNQDIRLLQDRNDFWRSARIFSHPSGPVVLLNNNTLLNLQ